MYWANFLHFYQPPDQRRYMMEKIVSEGYRPLIKILHRHKNAYLTFNINACLLDKLAEFGMDDVIDGFRSLVARGTVELTACVKYHPFLPLLKRSEIVRQIKINNDTLRYYFKDLYKPFGFFSPEAGYSRELGILVSSLGYRWMIADEIAYSGRLSFRDYDFSVTPGFYSGGRELDRIVGKVSDKNVKRKKKNEKLQFKNKKYVDYTKIYQLRTSDQRPKTISQFYIFFRERIISDAIASGQIRSGDQFLAIIKADVNKRRYLLTGTDGEAYGHHQAGLELVLDDLLTRNIFKTATISKLLTHFSHTEIVDPYPSTWGTSEDEMQDGYYYSRWLDPRNKIHKMQWDLTHLAIYAVEKARKRGDPTYETARQLLDQALYSCHFWWAAARPWWSIEIIERGSKYLLDVVRALGKEARKEKAQARKLYIKIITTAFDWLRKELVWDLSHRHK